MNETIIYALSRKLDRRDFLLASAGGFAALAFGSLIPQAHAASSHTLPPLPYAKSALAPVISAKTVGFHYGKHHKGYLKKMNRQIAGGPFSNEPIEKIVIETAKSKKLRPIFRNAAQFYNHSFYWKSLSPKGGGEPPAALKKRIIESFGSLEALKKEMVKKGTSQFGSGWVWLVLDKGKLSVVKTRNAGNPLVKGMTPLLTIDVWEHAYYLDYQNRRKDYIVAVLDKLINWKFALENLS